MTLVMIGSTNAQVGQILWEDNFNSLNTEVWNVEIGDGCPDLCGWGNDELQYYREENANIEDGNLVITAKKESFGGKQYTSTRMISQNKQSFKNVLFTNDIYIDILVLPKGVEIFKSRLL